MGVRIEKLITRCRVSRRQEGVARTVDRVARQRLATELTPFVGPALARQPPVVRIRRLNVKLELGANELGEDALAAAWVRALTRSLFAALAQTDGSGSIQIVCADSQAEFRAAFLRDLLAGQADGRWEYAEFTDLLRMPVAEAAMALLLSEPSDIIATLNLLDKSAVLDRLLARLDELALERLFAVIAESGTLGSSLLTPADLLWAAGQTLAVAGGKEFILDSRRWAMRLFIQAKNGAGRSPRLIYHALLALVCLLECPALLTPTLDDLFAAPEEIDRRIGRRFPAPVLEFLRGLSRAAQIDFAAKTALLEALDGLRPLVPTAAPLRVEDQPPWLGVDFAGLLLLVRVMQRLGWSGIRGDPMLAPWDEPRYFQMLLIGIGVAVLGRKQLLEHPPEPAVLYFAGMEREPDTNELRQTFASFDAAGGRRLLQRLLPGKACNEPLADWPAVFDALAAGLVAEFAALIRGFGDSPRAAIVRQFLQTPGRVQVSEQLVSVLLEPSPYHVALRISGLDEMLPSISWMGGRGLAVRLLGV